MITLIRAADNTTTEKQTIIIQKDLLQSNVSDEVLALEAELLFNILYENLPVWTLRQLSRIFIQKGC